MDKHGSALLGAIANTSSGNVGKVVKVIGSDDPRGAIYTLERKDGSTFIASYLAIVRVRHKGEDFVLDHRPLRTNVYDTDTPKGAAILNTYQRNYITPEQVAELRARRDNRTYTRH